MRLNRIGISLGALLLVPIFSWAACIGSSPNWSSTPDYDSVDRCVRSARLGDRINVSAGSATWSGTLSLNKPVQLIGSGVGNTIISGSKLITINSPANTTLLRISGFTFIVGSSGGPIVGCTNGRRYPPSHMIRIDHNKFTCSGTCTTGHCGMINEGCRGVVDNNIFEKMDYPLGVGDGDFPGNWDWNHYPDVIYGAANDNMYVEDNTFANLTRCLTDCDTGGRYAIRYNTIIPGAEMYPVLDTHNGLGTVHGCMGVEVYGNYIVNGGTAEWTDYRGGRLLTFYNFCAGSCYSKVSNNEGCPPQPISRQNINTAYFWANRDKNGTMSLAQGSDACSAHPLVENSSYWKDNFNCIAPKTCANIAVGVGCGTLANRPPSCTTGTGYWATNQSCSDFTGMVGVNPKTPISGTLYKCTSTNTWTAFYTPHTYPHPLRKIIQLKANQK